MKRVNQKSGRHSRRVPTIFEVGDIVRPKSGGGGIVIATYSGVVVYRRDDHRCEASNDPDALQLVRRADDETRAEVLIPLKADEFRTDRSVDAMGIPIYIGDRIEVIDLYEAGVVVAIADDVLLFINDYIGDHARVGQFCYATCSNVRTRQPYHDDSALRSFVKSTQAEGAERDTTKGGGK